MKKWMAYACCCCGLMVLGACNTVKGVGQDLQKAGSAIENAAKKN